MSRARIDQAVAGELAKLVRVHDRLDAAHAGGRISAHDRDERLARAEQWYLNRVAFIRGDDRPRQRATRPLDDPSAGIVG